MALRLILLFLWAVPSTVLFADSWNDPEWQRMIDFSDAIVRITYLEEGKFRALARVDKIYEGNIAVDTILISGFSNRYGPIDSVRVGDSFVAFLQKANWTEETLNFYREKADDDSTRSRLLVAYEQEILYYVWSPTSGDYKIDADNDSVSISLLQTTYWGHTDKLLLTELEAFLHNRKDRTYQEQVLNEIATAKDTLLVANGLLKLAYGHLSTYNEAFDRFGRRKSNLINYALSNLLRGVNDEKSLELLLDIYDHSSDYVQGHIVESILMIEVAGFNTAERLSDKLRSSFQFNIYSGSIMNPIMNEYRGGGLELIRALAIFKHEPDENFIVDLAKNAQEDALLLAAVEFLDSIQSERIPEVLVHLLARGSRDLLFEVISTAAKRQYQEFKQPLMNYIDTFDRAADRYPFILFSASSGIGAYEGEDVEAFIYQDIEKHLRNASELPELNQQRYIKDYLELLAKKRYSYSKYLAYQILEYWYGAKRDFHDLAKMNTMLDSLERIKTYLAAQYGSDSLSVLEILPVYKATEGASIVVDLRVETIHLKPKLDSLAALFYDDPKVTVRKVYLQRDAGYYYSGFPERFDTDNYDQIVIKFLKVLEGDIDEKDLHFVRNITDWPLFKKRELLTERMLEFVEEHR